LEQALKKKIVIKQKGGEVELPILSSLSKEEITGEFLIQYCLRNGIEIEPYYKVLD